MIVEYDQGGATPGTITHVVIIHQADFPDYLTKLGATFVQTEEASADPDFHYVADGALTPRPAAPVSLSAGAIKADGADTAILSGVPAGWQITIDDGAPIEADGSDLEITGTVAHTYHIVAAGPWPFAVWRGSIVCA